MALRAPVPLAPLQAYLAASTWIDQGHPAVLSLARSLTSQGGGPSETARACFEWVRDEVLHSADHRKGPATCAASDVLRHRTGYCYAKSHLLAALLRANGIPAGLTYQRFSLDGEGAPFALHGLVALHLPDMGWYRVDPRGNKPGVDARFTPPRERLAFTPRLDGEWDDPAIHPEPLPEVVACLTRHATWDAILGDLPDRMRPYVPTREQRAPPG